MAEDASVNKVRAQVEAGAAQSAELTGILNGVSGEVTDMLSTVALADAIEELANGLTAREAISGSDEHAPTLLFGAVAEKTNEANDILNIVTEGSVDPLHRPHLASVLEANEKSAVAARGFGTVAHEMSLALRGVATTLREAAPGQVAVIKEKTAAAVVSGNTAADNAVKYVKGL